MAHWNYVNADLQFFEPNDLLFDADNMHAYDAVKEYDGSETDGTFVKNFGYGMTRYRWLYFLVRITNHRSGAVMERRYKVAQVWPSPQEMDMVYRPHCRCGYCTSSWLSWTWLRRKPEQFGCLKVFAPGDSTRMLRRTRDYLIGQFGSCTI